MMKLATPKFTLEMPKVPKNLGPKPCGGFLSHGGSPVVTVVVSILSPGLTTGFGGTLIPGHLHISPYQICMTVEVQNHHVNKGWGCQNRSEYPSDLRSHMKVS